LDSNIKIKKSEIKQHPLSSKDRRVSMTNKNYIQPDKVKRLKSEIEMENSKSTSQDEITMTANNRLADKNILTSEPDTFKEEPMQTLRGFDFDWATVRTLIVQQLRKHFEVTEKKVSNLEQLVNFHDL
jgi:hypothetical protein